MALRGGSFFSDRQPAFSRDGRFLLVCTGCSVAVLSVSTGLRVAELEGHSERVTGVVVVSGLEEAKSTVTQAWTSSWDKTIRLWNFLTSKQIKVIDVGYQIVSMVIPGASSRSSEKQDFAFLSVAWEKTIPEVSNVNKNGSKDQGEQQDDAKASTKKRFGGYTGRAILFHITKQKMVPGHLAQTRFPRTLTASPAGGLVGMVDQAKVWIWKVPSENIAFCAKVLCLVLHSWQPLTTMAFDPTETTVAAGDERGLIQIWKNIGERTFQSDHDSNVKEDGKQNSRRADANDDAASSTSYHWHREEVVFLCFSSDAAYLLSGGTEAVLVMWHVETGNQRFLPRLGSPCRHVASAPDPSLFVLSMADNSLKFINTASMKADRVIQGIKPFVPCPDVNVTKLALQDVHGNVALPSVNLTVQFYDVLRDKHVGEIQVTPRNFVCADQPKDSFAQSTLVTHVAFSADTSVMVSVELRVAEAGVGGGSFLKFWTKDAGKAPYTLHTTVDNPHSAEILALAYHPLKHIAVTCSRANDFKLWVQTGSNENKMLNWRCDATGSYKQKRMQAAAFSPDGTLLAVAAEEIITLWNPLSNTLICVLCVPGGSCEAIGLLSFVWKSRYLVSASFGKQCLLTVWNLSTLSLWWAYKIKVEAITVDPKTSHFAVLASTGKKNAQVCLFEAANAVPVSVWDFKDGGGGTVQFLPSTEEAKEAIDSTSSSSKLLVFNKYREYVLFDPFAESNAAPAPKIHAEAAIEDALNAYKSLYITTPSKPKPAQRDQLLTTKGSNAWQDLLNAPSHVLPPLTDIGEQILESFLLKRTQ